MKYVELGKESPKTAESIVWNVRKLSCGPNFVLNRIELFKEMISSQGTIFWFRFWLNFTLNTIFPVFKRIQFFTKGAKAETSYLAIELHKAFIEVSEKKRYQCSLKAVKFLLKPPSMKADIYEMCSHYYTMVFGTAICEMFHKWLRAPSMRVNQANYWTTPIQLFDIDYLPGKVEKYLTLVWKDDVTSLLGLARNELPKQLKIFMDCCEENPLVNNIHKKISSISDNILQPESQKLAQCKLHVQQKIVEISRLLRKTDETPNLNTKIRIKRIQSQFKTMKKPKKIQVVAENEKLDSEENLNTLQKMNNNCKIREYNLCFEQQRLINWLESRSPRSNSPYQTVSSESKLLTKKKINRIPRSNSPTASLGSRKNFDSTKSHSFCAGINGNNINDDKESLTKIGKCETPKNEIDDDNLMPMLPILTIKVGSAVNFANQRLTTFVIIFASILFFYLRTLINAFV